MSKIRSASDITMRVVLELNEDEARALYQMTSYGSKHFTDWFYEHLGKHYLKPHEKGLVSLFKTVREELPQHLKKIDKAREIIK